MLTNADITLFNRWNNTETKKVEYRRTVIKGVNWHTDQKVSHTDKGLQSADVYKIRIPEAADTQGKKYILPKEFRKLPAGELDLCWTIDNADYFVKGIVADVDQAELVKKYDYVGQIKSFSDNRRGGAPHFRIGGW